MDKDQKLEVLKIAAPLAAAMIGKAGTNDQRVLERDLANAVSAVLATLNDSDVWHSKGPKNTPSPTDIQGVG